MTDNTFKLHTFVLKEDGKFYCKLDGSWIEVSDQEAMKERIKFLPPISVLPVNVPINMNCRVEVIEEWIPGQGYKSPSKEIARVTFDEQPEKKKIVIVTDRGYAEAFDGTRRYKITFDTIQIRAFIEAEFKKLIHGNVKYSLPSGYRFELIDGHDDYVAKICKSEPEAAGQEQEAAEAFLKGMKPQVADFDKHDKVAKVFDYYDMTGFAAQFASQQTASLQKQVESLEKENAAANKRIEELTTKNLKLLNENNDLWDKVNNSKMKV